MAYVSFRVGTEEKIGLLQGEDVVPFRGLTRLGPTAGQAELQAAELDTRGRVPISAITLLPASPRPEKVFCVGLNYLDHVSETGRELPTYPVLFPKFASNLIAANDDIQLPPESRQVDYEGELAVVIGTRGRRISIDDAAKHILGYSVANDITMRDHQYKTHQWMQGKAWDNSTPLGPYIIAPEDVDTGSAGIRTVLNGVTVQESDLSFLIFTVPKLISYLSEFTELNPGDVILTGTPGGVGFRQNPQLFLKDGDVISVEVDGVGRIENRVKNEFVEARTQAAAAAVL